MNWQTTDEGHYCARHSYAFPRGEVCQSCVTDPGPMPSSVEDDEEDRTLAIWQLECESEAKKLWRVGSEMIDGTDRDVSAGAKAYAEGTKIRRLALEIYEKRAAREHDLRLIRHEREMSGLRGSH